MYRHKTIGRRIGGGALAGFSLGRSHPVWAAILLVVLVPISALGQVSARVQGRVVARTGSPPIEGARVELVGHGITESSEAGTFRFERVGSGSYILRVSAVGYAPASLPLVVASDTMVTVQLDPVPFRLDSVTVTARQVDVQGQVRDTTRMELPIRDAEILTSQVPPTRTDGHGRFRLRDVWEGTPIAVTVSVFGYMPLDTTLIASSGTRYVLNLVRDSVAERMIARQVERLAQRAAGRLSVLMRPLTREALLRSGGGSLRDILRARYSIHLRRLRCVLVDDVMLPQDIDGDILGSMTPESVERVEVLFNGAMLRIYTRDFIRRMVSRRVDLQPPVYVSFAKPPVCQ